MKEVDNIQKSCTEIRTQYLRAIQSKQVNSGLIDMKEVDNIQKSCTEMRTAVPASRTVKQVIAG